MKVLVAVASRYGSTHEIADRIGQTLRSAGHQVDVVAVDDAPDLDRYDAAVIGSAVYAGHWLEPAKALVEENEYRLQIMPVWLFSSGPVGDPPEPSEDPADAAPMTERSDAREHRVFGGKLDRSVLRFTDKAVVVTLRAPEGDWRDFAEIERWAREIADHLDNLKSSRRNR